MLTHSLHSFVERLRRHPRESGKGRHARWRHGRALSSYLRPGDCDPALEILEDRLLLSAAPLVETPPVIVNGSAMPLSSAQPVSSSAGSPATASAAIQIKPAANSPPTVTAPASEVVVQNASFGFYYFLFGLSDAAATDTSDSVTVTASQGTLSVTPGSGLGITGNSTTSLTLTGTLTTMDVALGFLVYTPNKGYLGADSVQISLTNANDGLTGSAAVAMQVEVSPTITAPGVVSLTENGSFNYGNSMSFADAYASGTSDSITLLLDAGTLTLGSTNGLTFVSGSNNSTSFTVSGTLANLNAAVNGLVFTPELRRVGVDTIILDFRDTGNGLWASDVLSLNVDALPAPVVTLPSTATVIENGSVAFPNGSINVSDSEDTGTNADSMSVSVESGSVTLGSTSGLTFTQGSNGSSSMTFTGTLANLNSALSGLVYTPKLAYAGGDVLSISEVDAWDAQLGLAGVTITINPLPSPIVTAPSDATVGENGLLTFGAGALSFTDTIGSGTSDALTLSVANGTLTLGSTNGLTFNSGANGSSSITVTGTLANLNAALDGLVYAPNAGDIGFDALQISVNDSIDARSGSAGVPITVGGGTPPVITVPAPFFAGQDDPYIWMDTFQVADAGAWDNSDSLTLTAPNGTISLGLEPVTFTSGSNNSSSMTINGPIQYLEDSLFQLQYNPDTNYVGPDMLQLTLSNGLDHLTASASVSIDDVYTPNVIAPANMYEVGNNPYVYASSGIKLTDLAATNTSDSLTVFMKNSSITLASTNGLTFTDGANGDAEMTVTGSIADLNAAVDGLSIAMPDYYPNSLHLTLSDSVDGFSAGWFSDVFPATNIPPAVSAPSLVSVPANGAFTFSAGAIEVTDATSGTESMPLWVSEGTLTLGSTNGLTFTLGSNGSSAMTVSGTLANVNAALNGLVYTPTPGYTGADSLYVDAQNTTDREWGEAIVTIDVGEQPSVSAPPSQYLTENGSLSFNNSIILTDPAAAGLSDSVSLSVADGAIGLGSTAGITILSGANNSSSMTISGTLANLNSALNLQYSPNASYLGVDTLQISMLDWGDSLTATASVPINVVVPPTVRAPASASLNENSSFTFAGTISATDSTAAGASDSITLSVANGTLTLGSIAGIAFSSGSNGSSSMTIQGSLTSLNAALSGLAYAPNLDYVGSDTLQISANDSIDRLAGSGRVALTINAVAPPAVTAPPTASLKENSSYTFAGSAFSLADATASGTSDSLTLSASFGKLTLATTTGLTFSSGSNNSSSMTVTGTLANLNSAVSNLVYTPNSGFSGHDTLAVLLSNSIDKLTGSASVAISVNPYVTAPASESVLENSSFLFSSSGGDPITATDGGAAGTSDSLTLTVLHGKLTLGSLTGLTITSGANGSSSITVQGTLANLNAALNGLVYAPATSYTGSDTLAVTVRNASDGLSGSASVAITVAMKKIVGGTMMAPAVAPTDTSTTDEPDQWAGVSAAVDVLDS